MEKKPAKQTRMRQFVAALRVSRRNVPQIANKISINHRCSNCVIGRNAVRLTCGKYDKKITGFRKTA